MMYLRKRCMDLVSFETESEYNWVKRHLGSTRFFWTSGRLNSSSTSIFASHSWSIIEYVLIILESDHFAWLCQWLTAPCLVDLIDVTLAADIANSKLSMFLPLLMLMLRNALTTAWQQLFVVLSQFVVKVKRYLVCKETTNLILPKKGQRGLL